MTFQPNYTRDRVRGGINLDLPATLYVYRLDNYVGYGVTNNFNNRSSNHIKFFNKFNVTYKLIGLIHSNDGESVFKAEGRIKSHFKNYIYNSPVNGFKRESLKGVDPDAVLSFARSVITDQTDIQPCADRWKTWTPVVQHKIITNPKYQEIGMTELDNITSFWGDEKPVIKYTSSATYDVLKHLDSIGY